MASMATELVFWDARFTMMAAMGGAVTLGGLGMMGSMDRAAILDSLIWMTHLGGPAPGTTLTTLTGGLLTMTAWMILCTGALGGAH